MLRARGPSSRCSRPRLPCPSGAPQAIGRPATGSAPSTSRPGQPNPPHGPTGRTTEDGWRPSRPSDRRERLYSRRTPPSRRSTDRPTGCSPRRERGRRREDAGWRRSAAQRAGRPAGTEARRARRRSRRRLRQRQESTPWTRARRRGCPGLRRPPETRSRRSGRRPGGSMASDKSLPAAAAGAPSRDRRLRPRAPMHRRCGQRR